MLYSGWRRGVAGALLLVFWSWVDYLGADLVTVDLGFSMLVDSVDPERRPLRRSLVTP